MTHTVQWRAYIGPKWLSDTNQYHWDWSALNDLATYTPAAATTLSSGMTSASTTVPCTDSSGFPSAAGVWVGPNGAGESWEYILYNGNAANVLGGTSVSRQTADNYIDGTGTDDEQSGDHSSGAAVRMWWPLDTANGTLTLHEYMLPNLCAVGWYADIQGVTIPQAALRNGHLVLIQKRTATTGDWGSWTNCLVGWLESPRVRDDDKQGREWTARIVGLDGVLGNLQAAGVRVGEMQVGGRATATASGTLARPNKESGQGEFTGANPTLDAQSVVDKDAGTLWISDRFVGKANTLSYPGAGYGSVAMISQIHVAEYAGEGPGHRWIELIMCSNDDLGDYYIIANDGYMLFPYSAYTASYSEGDRIIIAENPTVFAADNPDHDAAAVLDAGLIAMYNGHHGRTILTLTGSPTGGTFTIIWDPPAFGGESDPIAYNATAANVQTAIDAAANGPYCHVHGPAGGPWYIDLIDTDAYVEGIGDHTFYLGTNSLTGGTSPSVDVDSTNPDYPYDTTNKGDEWFTDHLSAAGGSLEIVNLVTGLCGVSWGASGTYWPLATDIFDGESNATAPKSGETLRFDFNTDAWQTGRVHTPGYNPNGTEWVLVELPGMGLELTSALTDSATDPIGIANVGGSSTDGLPSSGTIQVGTEQISYTSKTTTTIAGTITRGANSTTAAAHSAGDPIYLIVSGVAVDALPVQDLTFVRTSGQPALYDFVVRGASVDTVRDPDTDNYVTDWTTLVTVTATSGTNYTAGTGVLDLSGSKPRLRWVLLEVTKMGTQPLRAMVNEIKVRFDDSVFDASTILDAATTAEAMGQILDNVGVPTGGYTGTTTGDVVDYTTAADFAWPVLVDMAEFANARITVGRDSKLTMSNNAFWTGSAPSESSEFTRASITYYDFNWRSGRRVGQVEITWRSPDNASSGTATYPSTADAVGRVVREGPYIYADQSAANTGAKVRFFQLRRPYDVIAEVPDSGWTYKAGDVYGFAVQVDAEMEAMDRTYRIIAADHEIRDYTWTTVLRGVQISRYNER